MGLSGTHNVSEPSHPFKREEAIVTSGRGSGMMRRARPREREIWRERTIGVGDKGGKKDKNKDQKQKKKRQKKAEDYRKGKVMSFNCPDDLVGTMEGQENRSAFIAEAVRAYEGGDVAQELRAIKRRLTAIEKAIRVKSGSTAGG